jgi:hypothetical protein
MNDLYLNEAMILVEDPICDDVRCEWKIGEMCSAQVAFLHIPAILNRPRSKSLGTLRTSRPVLMVDKRTDLFARTPQRCLLED